ncbi:MAG: hypothetical protein OEW98_03525 [Betaproteobacteria bacterium]|nr:hypothetical protein [Betaproteobacteria bacterium]
MPRITGLAVEQRLRENRINPQLIAGPARHDDGTRAMARTLVAQFFLRKPVDDRALLDVIGGVVDART